MDHPSGIDILQGFERQPVTLLLLIAPGVERLLHHPAARAFESRGHCFNLFREPQRDMRGQYLRLGRHVYHLLSVRLKYNHTDEKTQDGEPWSREPGEGAGGRSEEHTSELQSLIRISYAVFCLKKKIQY